VERSRISATVRGTRNYRTSWQWDGDTADPHCTCAAAPICKHAFALALAIDRSRQNHDPTTADATRGPRRDAPELASRRYPFRGDIPRGDSPVPDRVPADLASDLEHWARSHAEAPARLVRAVFGLHTDEAGRAGIWMEARVTAPRLADAPRTTRQVLQLASDLRRDLRLLAPPHRRLLRVLVRTLPHQEPLKGGTRFAVKLSTLNRLLDSFSDSPLATWDHDTTADAQGNPVREPDSGWRTPRSTSSRRVPGMGPTCVSRSRSAGRTAACDRSKRSATSRPMTSSIPAWCWPMARSGGSRRSRRSS
jgi:hypothetical protein